MQVRRDLMVMVAVLVAAVCLMPVAACGGSPAKGAERAQEPVKAPPPEVPYDHAVTDTAKILAGVPPEDATRFAALLKRPSWTAHRSEFDSNWSRVSAERFPAMRAWRDREFKTIADTCGTLFYPFGGPDFLNAYILFPNCRRYLLFGLEPVGSVPALERLADPRVDAVLGQLRESLSDVFLRDYFITKTMMNELQTPEVDGTVPLMLAFLARLDAHVVSIEFDDPIAAAAAKRAAGTAKPAPADAKPGATRPASKPTRVTIVFVAAGATQPQTLVYYRVNMQDPEFAAKTELIADLKAMAPFTTFVKSASYLMHDDRFATIRSMVLGESSSILQDDTGVPYRFFDKATWALTLYGKYTAPISDFKYGFQKDLDAAFKVPSAAHDLTFTFGYHWRMGTSSVMLAVKQPATH